MYEIKTLTMMYVCSMAMDRAEFETTVCIRFPLKVDEGANAETEAIIQAANNERVFMMMAVYWVEKI